MADRYFIVYLSTKHELGIYSLAYKLGSIIKLSLVTPLALSWGPYIFSIENEKNAMEKYMGVFKLYTIGGLLVVTLLSVYSIEVLSFLTSTNEYIKAVKIIPIICYAFFIFGLSPIVRTGILLSGKTYLSTIDVTIAMLFNLLSNYILIDLFEVYGAAFSLLLTMILLIFLHSRNSFVVYNLKFNFYLFLENISVSIFTVVFSLIFILFDFKHGFCYRTCIVIIFLRYLYSRGGMSVTEKQKLIAAISQPVLYFFKRKKQDV
jgi:O-antigen/teichoic acid export membrane protein